MNNTILVAEHDIEFTSRLSFFLDQEGFNSVCVFDGETAVKKALNQPFAGMILEIILTKLNGFEVLQTLREHKIELPILILTGRSYDTDRLLALELGADDFLTKPCDHRELIARLRAILRRVQPFSPPLSIIERQGIHVDSGKRLATQYGQAIELTNAEFNILYILIKSPNQAFSKEELTEYALGRKYTAFDRSIDVHISNLRSKLGGNKKDEFIIKTVRGFGYMFTDE